MADKIVVMHDGVIEQIGTPLELFDTPANLFVAQFIGSPSMNVVKGHLVSGAQGQPLVSVAGFNWPIALGLNVSMGSEVYYGVRPTDMFLADAGQGVPAQVIVVEPTGAETELLVRVGEDTLTLVVQGRTQVNPEDTVYLGVKTDKVHLFDASSEKRI